MIKFEHVSKSYKNKPIFDDVNFTISDHQIVRINGVNGIGKSVLLKMIVGYARADSGVIEIDGKVMKKDIDLIPNAGVSINNPEFLSWMSGLDNLKELNSIRHIASVDEMMALAERLKMDQDMKRKCSTYSLGMKQKLRMIQALMDKPQYLILDEPFDALDREGKAIATDMIMEYFESHPSCTVIYTSHESESGLKNHMILEIDGHKVSEIR